MSKPSETLIRLPAEVQHALDHTARQTGTSRSEIVEQAVRAYLPKISRAWLQDEARRQSLLARDQDLDDDAWENNADTSGWKA